MNPNRKGYGLMKIAAVLAACAVTQALLGYESAFGVLAIVPLTGKLTVKDLATKAKDLRTQWLSARKAKKDEAEIKAFETEVNRLQKFLDDAEADGKAETDEIELKAPEANEYTAEEVDRMIGKSVISALKAELPGHLKNLPTEEGIKTLIVKYVNEIAGDSKKISQSDIGTVVDKAVKTTIEGFRKSGQLELPSEDAGHRREHAEKRYDIEIPESLTKGNLPLHYKQLLNVMLKKQMDDGIDANVLARGKALGDRLIHSYRAKAMELERHRNEPGMKALTSTGSATGDEFVPTDLSSQLQRRLFLVSNLAAVMSSREIDMPSNPYTLPLSTTRPTMYLETTENTAATGSTPGTGLPTLTAIRLVGQTDFSYELDEDSIIPVLPMLQMLLAESAADAFEDVLINGDTTGTHQDSDTDAIAKAAAKGFKGFRKLALAISGLKTDLSSGGITTNANLLAVRKLLKKYGGDPRNLIWLCSPTSAITLQGIAEVLSVDKFGTRATILTGEIAALQGIPIIQSERVREDVNASGVYDGTTVTKSTVQCVNISRFLTGRRREIMVEVDKDIQSGKNIVVASLRKAFTPIETPSSTITSVAVGYNFSP